MLLSVLTCLRHLLADFQRLVRRPGRTTAASTALVVLPAARAALAAGNSACSPECSFCALAPRSSEDVLSPSDDKLIYPTPGGEGFVGDDDLAHPADLPGQLPQRHRRGVAQQLQ